LGEVSSKRQAQVPRPTCDIHHPIRRFEHRQLDGLLPPALVLPEAVQAIVEIVTGGDRGKHPLNARSLIRDGVRIAQELVIPCGLSGICRSHLRRTIICEDIAHALSARLRIEHFERSYPSWLS